MSRIYPTTTIASGASESGPVDVEGSIIGAVRLPAAWTAADLTVLASHDGDTYVPVYAQDGTEFTIDAAADRWVNLPREATESFHHVKLRSGTAALAVNQAAARTIILALISVEAL